MASTKKSTSQEKVFCFNDFASCPKQSNLKLGEGKVVYNYCTEDNTLKTGYGFKILSMPNTIEDLGSESDITLRGNEVKTIWKLKWYNNADDTDHYYLFYYNNENLICYDNLFGNRDITYIIPNDFTETPYVAYYRRTGGDALLLSGDEGLMSVSGMAIRKNEDGPKIISCCSHYGRMFAITAAARGSLVYSETTDILEWTDEKTSQLDFGDERGDLTKVLSFNDYIYLFRDYGITKLSIYSSSGDFAISHDYLADSFIYPNSICQSGDYIYFLQEDGLKVFNGSSVKNIQIDCIGMLKGEDNSYCYGTTFNGKYYLACRANFGDGETIGCESGEYKNNAILIYDLKSGHVDIVRGVDVKVLLALVNPYKSKLVACFNGENKDKIGELCQNGKIFVNDEICSFMTGKIDFSMPNKTKKIKSLLINTKYNCKVEFKSEKKEKSVLVKGKNKTQKVNINMLGKEFIIKISSNAQTDINNFVLTVKI